MRGFRRTAREFEAKQLQLDEFFLRSGWLRLDGPQGPMYVNPKDPAHQTAEFKKTVTAMGYDLSQGEERL